jgi:hypothetical protein
MYVFRHGMPNAFQPGGRNRDYQLLLGPSTKDYLHRHEKNKMASGRHFSFLTSVENIYEQRKVSKMNLENFVLWSLK